MKKQKLLFNHLLRRYKKATNRLNRLIQNGRNERRQRIMKKQIERLYDQLISLELYIKKGAVIGSVAVATVAFDSHAQDFNAPQSDPFNLSFPGVYLSNAAFADLDGDGDMDMLSGEFGYTTGSANFYYYENIGTSSTPNFSAPQSNAFGMSSAGEELVRPAFVDIDGDGDFDIVAGTYYGEFLYLENTGTTNAPAFAAPINNPFGLNTIGDFASLSFVDLDGDGDFDMMGGDAYEFSYFENTGSANAPAFGAAQSNPFSIQPPYSYGVAMDFADLDFDGDMDMLVGGNIYSYSGYGGFAYYENVGSANVPSFGNAQLDAFNIQATGAQWTNVGFADLNGDGLPDFMSGSIYGEFFYFEGNCAVTADATPACTGADGSVETTVAIPGSGFTYQWSNGATTPDITGLSVGSYDVTVTSAGVCTVTDNATVDALNAQPLQAFVGAGDITCFGDNDGGVQAIPFGGNSPYSYLWSNGSTQNLQYGVPAGIYSVTLTDACGAQEFGVDTISEPLPLSITTGSTNESAPLMFDGTASVTVTGGTMPVSYYYWSNGESTPTITGLYGGVYSVQLEDANGCYAEESVTVTTTGCNISVNMVELQADDCGYDEGMAVAIPSGGTAPYYIDWNNGSGSDTAMYLSAGNVYTATVYDNAGCSGYGSITISGGNGIDNVQITAVDPSCGNNDGSATVAVTGGTAPFSYIWYDVNQNIFGTTASISGLAPGAVIVEVEDANGCTQEDYEFLSNPGAPSITVLTTDETCAGTMDGSIEIVAIGGTTPYNYTWFDFDNGNTITGTDPVLTGLSGGTTYLVTVADAATPSCSTTGFGSVDGGDEIFVDDYITEPSCAGGSNGDIYISPSGGEWPYTYQWNNGATSDYITGLTAGIYEVTITDDNGCSEEYSIDVTEPDPIAVSVTVVDATCGNSDGSITAYGSNGWGNYYYSWSNGQFGPTTSSIPAGLYTVTVSDDNGCSTEATAAISNSDGPGITITSTDITCNGNADGEVMLTSAASGYTYTWSNGSVTEDLSGVAEGTYSVTVSDAGCNAYASVDVNEPDAIVLSTSSTDESAANASDGTADVTASGGTGVLTYDWGTAGTGTSVTNLTGGTYTVTATDANGCSATASVTISTTGVNSVEEIDEAVAVRLFPNPNNGNFVVTVSRDDNYTVIVRNLIGQQVDVNVFNGTTHEVSLHNIETGVYFVTILADGFEKTEKVIVR